jgi:uncharacterized repeat protein (TIGR01451 family)
MKLWNFTAKACVTTLVVAGTAIFTACGGKQTPGAGLEAYGRAPSAWVAPEGGETTKPMPKPAPAPAPAPVAAKPAPAPAPAPAPGNCMYIPTGDRSTSSLSLCCKMPSSVIAGQNFTYEVEICNLTNMDLNNVVVVYTLDGARIVSSEPPITGTGFGVGDLGPKACKSVKVVANAATVGSVKGCTSATWTNAMCCVTNVVQPALKIVKSVTPDNGTPCDSFTYKIDVSNTGTGAATNVKVNDNLPAGVTSDGKSALAWDIGTLATGQTVTKTFTAKAAKVGSYTNNASTTADNNLSATSNNVAITVKAPQLAIAKTCPGVLRVGRPASFKITVTNKGDAPASNTRVEDTIPAGATFVSATDGGTFAGGKVTWNVGTLAPGASKEVSLTTNVAGQGNLQNNASASCTCAETVTANCSFSVQGSPDLGTLLTDDDGVVLIGDNHIMRYEVENQGQVDLTNVTVVVTLPEGLSFVASSAPKPPVIAGNKLTFTGVLGVLKPGEHRNFTLTVKSSQPGEKLTISETTCDQLKTPIRDDELTFFVDR